jgi:hypothetical protein
MDKVVGMGNLTYSLCVRVSSTVNIGHRYSRRTIAAMLQIQMQNGGIGSVIKEVIK